MSARNFSLLFTLAILGALLGAAPLTAHAQATPAAAPTATPAATTEAPTTAPVPAAEPAPTSAAPAAAAEPAPTEPPTRAKWTRADVARVRAMLRASQGSQPPAASTARGSRTTAPQQASSERVRGDAGAAFAIGFSIDAVWNDDAGYDFFADNDVASRFGAYLGYDLLSLSRDLFVAGEVGFGVESEGQSGLLGGPVDTELSTVSFFGAASLRYAMLPWLQPHARLAAGVSLLSMSLTAGGEPDDEDAASAPFASLGAGILLRSPTRALETQDGRFASLSFGVLVEGGYTLAADADFAMEHVSNDRDIERAQAKLGTLSLGGPYIRTSLVARF